MDQVVMATELRGKEDSAVVTENPVAAAAATFSQEDFAAAASAAAAAVDAVFAIFAEAAAAANAADGSNT